MAAEFGVADRVEWREYVERRRTRGAVPAARVFVFLSDYEGFAMTPLEAIAHGVPRRAARHPGRREVYGGGAVRVPPDAGGHR